MHRYQIAREAQDDLFDIQRYTQAQWGRVQSEKYLSELFSLFSMLASYPDMGRPVSFNENLFRFPHQNHVVYFLKNTDTLIFVAVMHQSRSPADIMRQRLHEPDVEYQATPQE